MTNPTPAPLSAEQLTRYDSVPGEAGRMIIDQDDNGAYVLRSDVLAMIAQARAAQPAQANDEAMIEEAVKQNNVYGVLPNSASTMSIGRAVLAAERRRAAQAHHAAASERARELANVIDYLVANGHMRWEGFDDDDEAFSSNSAEFQAILSLVKAALPYRAEAKAAGENKENTNV